MKGGGVPPAGRACGGRHGLCVVCSAFPKALPPPSVAGLARRLAACVPPRGPLLGRLRPGSALLRASVGRPRFAQPGRSLLCLVARPLSGCGSALGLCRLSVRLPRPAPLAPGQKGQRKYWLFGRGFGPSGLGFGGSLAGGLPRLPGPPAGGLPGVGRRGVSACGRVRPACAWSLPVPLVVPWPLGVFRRLRAAGCQKKITHARVKMNGTAALAWPIFFRHVVYKAPQEGPCPFWRTWPRKEQEPSCQITHATLCNPSNQPKRQQTEADRQRSGNCKRSFCASNRCCPTAYIVTWWTSF
jgi:hypothetical protein